MRQSRADSDHMLRLDANNTQRHSLEKALFCLADFLPAANLVLESSLPLNEVT